MKNATKKAAKPAKKKAAPKKKGSSQRPARDSNKFS